MLCYTITHLPPSRSSHPPFLPFRPPLHPFPTCLQPSVFLFFLPSLHSFSPYGSKTYAFTWENVSTCFEGTQKKGEKFLFLSLLLHLLLLLCPTPPCTQITNNQELKQPTTQPAHNTITVHLNHQRPGSKQTYHPTNPAISGLIFTLIRLKSDLSCFKLAFRQPFKASNLPSCFIQAL